MQDDIELWRPVVAFEGFYEVSDRGRIRSVARWTDSGKGDLKLFPGRLFTLAADRQGYLHVQLSRGGRSKNYRVHRLVCEAFHGGANPGQEVRHLNGNPGDNRPANLKWGTGAENAKDTIVHGRNHELNKTHCPKGHPYNVENTYVTKRGHRTCRACHRQTYRDKNPGSRHFGPYNTSDGHCKNGHLRTEANTYVNKRGHRSCRVCHREYQRELKRRQREHQG